jgi:hypothetical protein
MLGSFHGAGQASHLLSQGMSVGLICVLVLVLALEANAIFGKIGPMATVKGVVHSSLGLAAVSLLLLQFV